MSKTAEPSSIKQLLEQASHHLPESDSARLDAEILLSRVTGKPRSHFHAWPEKTLSREILDAFDVLLQRRAAGEPIAYITGQREFWSLPLSVTTDTLIPRPETETLVALALEKIPEHGAAKVADLGTGSGAIALAIAAERPLSQLIAIDSSEAALKVAQHNARQLGISNIEFLAGNWCEPLPAACFDLVVSNPPYIEEADTHLTTGDVRFEPRRALAAGPDGMRDLGRICQCALESLKPGGWLLMEHGYNQETRAMDLLEQAGYRSVTDFKDDNGLPRVVAGRK